MKICVIGGNGEVGRFGRDFCDLARADGHEVYVLSHDGHMPTDPPLIPFDDKHVFAKFGNSSKVYVKAFNDLLKDVDKLDIMLYNSNSWSYPSEIDQFQSTSSFIENGWEHAIRIHAAIPHALSLAALHKMDSTSKVVFVTSGLSFTLDRDYCTEEAGYAGCKGAQNQLMIALAHHNDKGVTFTSFAPDFSYHNPKYYQETLGKVYNHVMTVGPEMNGKIVEINPTYDWL